MTFLFVLISALALWLAFKLKQSLDAQKKAETKAQGLEKMLSEAVRKNRKTAFALHYKNELVEFLTKRVKELAKERKNA